MRICSLVGLQSRADWYALSACMMRSNSKIAAVSLAGKWVLSKLAHLETQRTYTDGFLHCCWR
jgi:hypothetical protein